MPDPTEKQKKLTDEIAALRQEMSAPANLPTSTAVIPPEAFIRDDEEPPAATPLTNEQLRESRQAAAKQNPPSNKYYGPPVNKNLLIAALIIGGAGVVDTWTNNNNPIGSTTGTLRVLVGTYVFILVLSLLDLVPGLRGVTSGLAWLAVIAALLQSHLFDFLKGVTVK
jgi:hypothetical protein